MRVRMYTKVVLILVPNPNTPLQNNSKCQLQEPVFVLRFFGGNKRIKALKGKS